MAEITFDKLITLPHGTKARMKYFDQDIDITVRSIDGKVYLVCEEEEGEANRFVLTEDSASLDFRMSRYFTDTRKYVTGVGDKIQAEI